MEVYIIKFDSGREYLYTDSRSYNKGLSMAKGLCTKHSKMSWRGPSYSRFKVWYGSETSRLEKILEYDLKKEILKI